MNEIRNYVRDTIIDTCEITEDFDMQHIEDLVDSVMNDSDFWGGFADTILKVVEREMENA